MHIILRIFPAFLLLFSFILPLSSTEVANKDKPRKGIWDFGLVKQWEIDSINGEVLGGISTLWTHENGNLYIVDYKRSRVFILDKNGKFVSAFGKKGEGPGEVKRMNTFYPIKGEKLAFPDNNRVHFFAADGKYIETKIVSDNVSYRGMINDNLILSVHYINWKDLKAKGKFAIYDIDKKKEKLLFEFSTFTKGVVRKSSGKSTHTYSYSTSSLTPMMSVSYQPITKKVYYGMTNDYKITVRDLSDIPNGGTGQEVVVFSLDRQAKEVPKGFKKNLMKGLDWPDHIKKEIINGFPDELTQFVGMNADERGYIYVMQNLADIKHRLALDIFSPKGEYIYKAEIAMGEGTNIDDTHMSGDNLYMVIEDEDGELKLAMYKIKRPN